MIRRDYWPFMVGILGLTRLHYAPKLWKREPRMVEAAYGAVSGCVCT